MKNPHEVKIGWHSSDFSILYLASFILSELSSDFYLCLALLFIWLLLLSNRAASEIYIVYIVEILGVVTKNWL